MSETCVLCIPLDEAASLGRLRLQSGIEVGVVGQTLWLRIHKLDDELNASILALPGTRFTLLPDGQLVKCGHRVPSGYLPERVAWIALSQWMGVRMEPAALAGTVAEKVKLKLVRGGSADATNVIVSPVATWQSYAINAPQVRLDCLAFAINDWGQAVIWGSPSPPIQGVRYVERCGVAVEAGWTWDPPVDHGVLAETLSLAPRDLALLHADGTWEHILESDFVRASRSAVRLSLEGSTDV